MKVRDLKKGQLLKPKESFMIFEGYSGQWINVGRIKHYFGENRKIEDQVIVYIGQKKDVSKNVRVPWSDRYVLFRGMVFAVDPHGWRKLEVVCESQ